MRFGSEEPVHLLLKYIYTHPNVHIVLIVKISCILFLHVVFTRIVYISHISKHDQLSSLSGPDNMGLIFYS